MSIDADSFCLITTKPFQHNCVLSQFTPGLHAHTGKPGILRMATYFLSAAASGVNDRQRPLLPQDAAIPSGGTGAPRRIHCTASEPANGKGALYRSVQSANGMIHAIRPVDARKHTTESFTSIILQNDQIVKGQPHFLVVIHKSNSCFSASCTIFFDICRMFFDCIRRTILFFDTKKRCATSM